MKHFNSFFYSFLGIFALFVVGAVGFSGHHKESNTLIQSDSTSSQNSSALTPTLYCLGSCPVGPKTIATSTSPSPSQTQPITSNAPSSSPSSTTTVDPCTTVNAVHSTNFHKKKMKFKKGGKGGFFEAFFKFLIELIQKLLGQFGGTIPGLPTPTPSITGTVSPTSPVSSTEPTQTTVPTTNPCAQLSQAPSSAPTIAPSTPATPATGSGTPIPSNKILFEDDFNGAAGALPDQSKWADYCTPYIFGLIRCGADEKLDGAGHLNVPATATWGSGLVTDGKFSFDYGTASAWIKLPKIPGYWPAFWTLNRTQGEPGISGEIDVMESYTLWPTISHFAVHAWNTNADWGDGGECNNNVDLSAAFHKYTAKIEPTQITFYLDDKLCGSGPNPITKAGRTSWPFAPDQPLKNYLMLDLAVGGAGGQQPTPTGPDTMAVDRVEVLSN